MPLTVAVQGLAVADEVRDGYDRSKFHHWLDDDHDGCSTRNEVLLEEAVDRPVVSPGCVLSGGSWYSMYDNVSVRGPSGLDVDHLVPLAEAWDSGAGVWSSERRAAFANDLGDPRALVAVTGRSNRSKADQDPAGWMPPFQPAGCEYVVSWVAIKTRWSLAVDTVEAQALREQTDRCPDAVVDVQVVAAV